MDHNPVMLNEAMNALNPLEGKLYMDGTFGAGGYSKAILEKGASLIAVDRDVNVSKYVDELQAIYKDKFKFINCNFGDLAESEFKLDGIVLDLGVSSMQLDNAERGFSFMHDGDLDMRMGNDGKSAKDFVNNEKEEEIARVIYEFGDEPSSRKIARYIVEARKESPIETTNQLASIVRKAINRRPGKIDLATKTFQAIRIWVNDELNSLSRFLDKALSLLKVGGKLVIVTFHSLEDRIVKHYFNKHIAKRVARSKYSQEPVNSTDQYELLYKKPLSPSNDEVRSNPRSRSAKLRAAVKLREVSDV